MPSSESLVNPVLSLVTDVGDKMNGDNYKMLATVLTLHYLLAWASGTKIQKMSPTLKFSHQHIHIVTNFKSAAKPWSPKRIPASSFCPIVGLDRWIELSGIVKLSDLPTNEQTVLEMTYCSLWFRTFD